jgi:acid stress chaperone HdeB
MKPTLVVLLCALCLSLPAQAKSSKQKNIDFNRISCGEFISDIVQVSDEDAAAVMLWIDGYLSGISGDTVLNWRGMEKYTERLLEFCIDHKRANLLDAARKVGIQ